MGVIGECHSIRLKRKVMKMKIAITAQEQGWDAATDMRFGRAQLFAIVTIEGDERTIEYVSNEVNRGAMQGAGIQAASNMSENKVEVLLTGFVGPKAFKALDAANVKVYTGNASTVQQALEDYLAGKYVLADNPNARGHH